MNLTLNLIDCLTYQLIKKIRWQIFTGSAQSQGNQAHNPEPQNVKGLCFLRSIIQDIVQILFLGKKDK
jgi:hypothetical protein